MAINIRMNDKLIIADKPSSKDSKKKKVGKIILCIFILIGIIWLCNYFLGQKTGLKLTVMDVFMPIKASPQLQKDSSGYTNFLLVGIDTQADNPGLKNTDTIILISYNHEKHESIMISIPRDFFVKVPDQKRYTKINSIYGIGEKIEKGTGIELLTTVVEEITNREIQYYGMVNLAGFVELIDIIGGIEVDVENSFTDYQYPIEGREHFYQTVSFKKGLQNMDGKTALRFVRSRMSINSIEGSDFARARRQQRVLIALKDKILSSETLLNPQKVFASLGLLEKNIYYSDFTNEELQATLQIFKKDDMKSYSLVLDPSLARFKLITDKGLTLDAYAIGPHIGLGKYEELHKYLENFYKNPLLYSEDPDILVYDIGIGNKNASDEVKNFEEKLPYINIKYMGTLFKDLQGKYLYKTIQEEKTELDSQISKIFSIEITEKPEFMKEKITNGDYIILLGTND